MKKTIGLIIIGLLTLSAILIPVIQITNVAPSRKAQWIGDAFDSILAKRYPRINAISYWNENWPNQYGLESQLCIDSSPAVLDIYRTKVASTQFITTPSFINIFNRTILTNSSNGIYHSAYPDFDDTEDNVTATAIQNFETLAQKPIMWAYFSNNWIENSIQFPLNAVKTIMQQGKIPFIRIMARSTFDENQADPIFKLASIINGTFDTALIKWAQDAKNVSSPLLMEFGTEVNGQWFPWNGQWNGAGITTGYGDPNKPDGPERFVDAYRHIINITRNVGCTNITWFYHVNYDSVPEENWNDYFNYYLGDEYIDWLGISIYGPKDMWSNWDNQGFSDLLDLYYENLTKISASKPIALLEFGADEQAGLGVQIVICGILLGILLFIGIIIVRKKE